MWMRWVRLDLLAQIADVQPDVVIFFPVLASPDANQQRLIGHQAARIRDEMEEESILRRRQCDAFALAENLTLRKIDQQVVVNSNLRLRQGRRHVCAPNDRLNATEQLALSER